MTSNKFLLSVFVFLFVFSFTRAQQVEKGTKMFLLPKDYENPDGKVLTDSKNTDLNTSRQWIVYADRDNVLGFNAASGGTVLDTYSFMDPLWVIGENGDKLHVVRYNPELTILKNQLPEAIKDGGWVSKSNLVLWNSSLQDPQTRIFLKALSVVRDQSVISNVKKYMSSDNDGVEIKLFNSPNLDPTSQSQDKSIRLFQWIFIVKETITGKDTSYLLSKTNTFSGKNSKSIVLGWVSNKIVTKWADCVCLEPNWDPKSVEERKQKGIKASLFFTQKDASNWMNGLKGIEAQWSDDTYDVRKEAQWKRLPVLNKTDEESKLIETGFVTPIFDQTGNKTLEVKDQVEMDKTTSEKILKLARTINIVVVVDGSENLKEFTPSIISAFNKSTSALENTDDYIFQYGAVIYRDYGFGNCNGRDLSVEEIPLSSSQSDVIDKLNQKLAAQPGCTDNSKYQAVYKGLNKAIRMLNNPLQSNFIVLIGSAANDPANTDYTKAQLIAMIAQSQISLFTVVAARSSDEDQDQFYKDAKDIIKQSALKIAQNSDKVFKDAGKTVISVEPNLRTVRRNVFALSVPDESPVEGFEIIPNEGQPLRTEVVSAYLDTIFFKAYNTTYLGVQQVTDKTSGMGERNIELNPLLKRYFANIIKGGVDPEIAKKYSEDNFQFFLNAYTTLQPKGLTYPIFKHVLLMTDREFQKVINQLEQFNTNVNGDELRMLVVNTYKQIAKTYLGSSVTDDMFKKMKPDNISKILFGLPSQSNLLRKYTIAKLEDPKQVSDPEIQQIVDLMNKSYDSLLNLAKDRKYTFTSFDTDFIWVPEDILP